MTINSILFDLDGTLADTSVDMCNALNEVLNARNFLPVECNELKKHISKGAVGIIKYASSVNGRSIDSSSIRSEFLEEYSKNCFKETRLVNGMSDLLNNIEDRNLKWGIVTNKHSKYVDQILDGLKLTDRTSCVVTGNMVSEPKPAPESIIKAMYDIKVSPSQVIYVGDDERDIIAGKSAGTLTAVADFGFILDNDIVNTWNADYHLREPLDLMKLI